MDVQIKTFHITNEADEQALNAFLHNKVIRHWSTSYNSPAAGALGAITEAISGGGASAHAGGTWNVFLAFEERMNGTQSNGRNERTERRSDGRPDGRPERGERQDRGAGRDKAPARNGDAPKREPKKEMAPREDYVPNVPEADLPLFEAVRKWRNARARDEKVKPFAFFNNSRLEELVKAKPSDESGLKALLPDMQADLFDRYKNELLGFLGGAMQSIPAEATASLG